MDESEETPSLSSAYKLSSILASLYSKFEEIDYHGKRIEFINECIDLSLDDVGNIHKTLMINHKEKEFGIPIYVNFANAKTITRIESRINSINKYIHIWTPIEKIPRILLRIERYFHSTVGILEREFIFDQKTFDIIKENIAKRTKILEHLSKNLQEEREKFAIIKNYQPLVFKFMIKDYD